MAITLVATDMDGTLLNEKREITERTVKTLNKLNERGVKFCLCSGRPPIGMIRFAERLGFDMPIITFNGAEVIACIGEKPIYENVLDGNLAKEVFDLGEQLCSASVAWESNRVVFCADNATTREYHRMSNAEMVFKDEVDIAKLPIRKVLWFGPDAETTERLRIEMMERYKGRLNVATSSPCLLEFVNHDVSKGVALTRLCEHLGLDVADSLAFGDGYNDLPMLMAAGTSVAMANAGDEIKAACDAVTLSNEQDGVADYIEKYILT